MAEQVVKLRRDGGLWRQDGWALIRLSGADAGSWLHGQCSQSVTDMKPGEGRMDFEFENFSAEFVEELETKVNVEVAQNRAIHAHNLSREEADQVPDLIRTKINLLPTTIQEIRTIDITGLDLQADGGTHVANTSEVGLIRVVGHESKGRINKRIRIALAD